MKFDEFIEAGMCRLSVKSVEMCRDIITQFQ